MSMLTQSSRCLARKSLLQVRSTQCNNIRRLLSTANYNNLIVSQPVPSVALVTLNRPKALNALNSELFRELNAALADAEADQQIGSMVITGSDKAFAAGADIKEMKDLNFSDVAKMNFLANWTMDGIRKPVIAAVSGYALGGGFELALMCDIIIASPTAKFGLPEITLGVIPGSGGTQRLTRAVGKTRAMDLILTGRQFSAADAEKWGVISRVVKEGDGEVVKEAIEVAKGVASKGQVAVRAAKEAVNGASQSHLNEGIHLERALFWSLFATKDQKEGMNAFAEKRKPSFTHE